MDWAAGLNGSGAITYDLNPGVAMNWTEGWRLPATVDGPYEWGYNGTTTAGYNITTSEMGHLFYEELGNLGFNDTSGDPQSGWGLTNTGDFENLYASLYWSGTEFADTPTLAWHFDTNQGDQYNIHKDLHILYGLAVRPGQQVPIPGALWLLGSGLAGLVSLRKWRQGNRI